MHAQDILDLTSAFKGDWIELHLLAAEQKEQTEDFDPAAEW